MRAPNSAFLNLDLENGRRDNEPGAKLGIDRCDGNSPRIQHRGF
jgi:hypothetical protein